MVITPFWQPSGLNLKQLLHTIFFPPRSRNPQGIEQELSYSFQNPQLLTQALTHRSSAANLTASYERLEFLGDAVLEMVISEHLFRKHPKKSEGDLTQYRSILVNREALYRIARQLRLARYCIIDKSVDTSCTATMRNLLSSMVEAIIGAIYLDGGLSATISFINRFVLENAREDRALRKFNYKGKLYELCQKNEFPIPEFTIQKETGPDHARRFQIACFIGGELKGRGQGSSKRTAEEQAAAEAYQKIRTTD